MKINLETSLENLDDVPTKISIEAIVEPDDDGNPEIVETEVFFVDNFGEKIINVPQCGALWDFWQEKIIDILSIEIFERI